MLGRHARKVYTTPFLIDIATSAPRRAPSGSRTTSPITNRARRGEVRGPGARCWRGCRSRPPRRRSCPRRITAGGRRGLTAGGEQAPRDLGQRPPCPSGWTMVVPPRRRGAPSPRVPPGLPGSSCPVTHRERGRGTPRWRDRECRPPGGHRHRRRSTPGTHVEGHAGGEARPPPPRRRDRTRRSRHPSGGTTSPPGQGVAHEQRVDGLLRHAVVARDLPAKIWSASGGASSRSSGPHQLIVDHDPPRAGASEAPAA